MLGMCLGASLTRGADPDAGKGPPTSDADRIVQELCGKSLAPGDSLEARAFAGHDSDTAYLSLQELRKFGPTSARPLGADFQTARWSEVLDGIVIFRQERVLEFVRH